MAQPLHMAFADSVNIGYLFHSRDRVEKLDSELLIKVRFSKIILLTNRVCVI